MNEDSKKDLEQLQMLLILDEEWFKRELDSAKLMIGQKPEQPAPAKTAPTKAAPAKTAAVRNYANGYGRTESRVRKAEPEEAPMPKRKGIKGLLILAGLETLGILGLAAYWVLVLLK